MAIFTKLKEKKGLRVVLFICIPRQDSSFQVISLNLTPLPLNAQLHCHFPTKPSSLAGTPPIRTTLHVSVCPKVIILCLMDPRSPPPSPLLFLAL